VRGSSRQRRSVSIAICCAIALFAAGTAQARPVIFNIPPQNLASALREFGRQSGSSIVYEIPDASALRSQGVKGRWDDAQALAQLLAGNPLDAVRIGGGFIIRPRSQPARGPSRPPTARPISPVVGDDATTLIVIARKRQESILNVPVMETAVSRDQLDRHQVQDLKGVAQYVPGLVLGQTLGVSGTQVSLRGVGSSALNSGIDASVVLNVDGVQMTQAISFGSALFDVGQVEVLKGPQGLFYGKNSPGGVIAIRTADPGSTTELVASAGYEGEARERRAELILSGPVSDRLRLRLAGVYSQQDGYYRNRAIAAPGLGGLTPADRDLPRRRNYVVRGTALWNPVDRFDARLKLVLIGDLQTGGVAFQYVSCPDGIAPVAGTGIAFLAGEDCRRNRTINTVGLDPTAFSGMRRGGMLFNRTREHYGSLELNYRPRDDITLTSVSGYYHLAFESQQPGISSSFVGPSIASIVDPLERKELTQELRINSDFSGPLDLTAGVFYQDGSISNTGGLPGNTALDRPAFVSNYRALVDIRSISTFGQLRWRMLPRMEIAAGGRWTDERRRLTSWNLLSGMPVLFPTAVPKIHSDHFSPELTLTYKPSDNLILFGSLKEAYKSGSFQLTTPSGVLPDLSFGDEKARGGEIGLKARLFDRRLTLGLAYYSYKYTGLQVGAIVPSITGDIPIARTVNAGAARVHGLDFDIGYRPPLIDGLAFRGAVEWNRARFTRLNNIPCWGGQTIAEGCTELLNPATGRFTAQNLAGKPLTRAPDWQLSFGFDYDIAIGRGLTLVVSNSNQYSSKYLAFLGLRKDFYQSAFFKTDLTFALKAPDNRWEVALIGKNLANRLTSSSCTAINAQNGTFGGQLTGGTVRGPAGIDELGCYMDRSRELWLRLSVHISQ
jgi:iron complex outermembrane receptor protein